MYLNLVKKNISMSVNFLIYYIQSLEEKKNIYILWGIASLLIFMRRPDMLLTPQPWAEDGTIFITQALAFSWNAIILPYAGYVHFFPRVVTMFAVELSQCLSGSLLYVPFIMNLSAVLLSAWSVIHLCKEKFKWLALFKYRFFASLCVIAIPHASEVFGSITNVHWWLGYYLFLESWNLYVTKRIPSIGNVFLLAATTLSSPLGGLWAVVIFFVLIQKVYEEKVISWNLLIVLIVTNIGTVIQWMNFNAIVTYPVDMVVFGRMFFGSIIAHLFLPRYPVLVNYLSFYPMIIFGIVLLIFTISLYAYDKKVLVVPLSFMILISFSSLYRNFDFANSFQLHYYENGGRYFFIPSAIFITLFLCGLTLNLKERNPKGKYLIYMLLVTSIVAFPLRSYENYNWKERIMKQEHEIPINPPGWKINLKELK